MQDVYKICPQFENEQYLLRLVSKGDCLDLLKVYSDKKAVPFFNSDNCNGDDFHYTTEKRMQEAINFWIFSYNERYFVRWSIIDKLKDEAIGTIELFHRDSADYMDNCGLLRLDIRSDYEQTNHIENILSLIIEPAYELFYCDKIATKAIVNAEERVTALEQLGFKMIDEKLLGHDNIEYIDYWVLTQ